MLRGDSFQYDDSGRLYQATQSNGLIHNYSTDDEGNLLSASSSSTDTTGGGGLGNGIADWWENYYFGTSGIDPNAAPLGDGVSNLMKFAMGLDPGRNVALGQVMPVTLDGGSLSLVFRVGKDVTNIVYTVQSSTDLVIWTDLAAETDAALAGAPLLGDENSDSYEVSVPIEGDKFFLRLKVSTP
jgi:hypothetical protein